MRFPRDLKGIFRFNENLSLHTTFKIGGPAKIWVEPQDIDTLRKIIYWANKQNFSILVIGAGSKLLIKDEGVQKVVIHLGKMYFRRIKFGHQCVSAGAGVYLSDLISNCLKRGFTGLEFLWGIPATLGGAIVMNAGIKEKDISTIFLDLTFMDLKGNIFHFKKKHLQFEYRGCRLPPGIVISATLKVKNCSPSKIRNKIIFYQDYRRKTQDIHYPNAGCIFKNPDNFKSAAKLIEACKLKGKRIGDAAISQRHANFIINLGKASFKDVKSLIDHIKIKVKEKFNVELIPEVRIVC